MTTQPGSDKYSLSRDDLVKMIGRSVYAPSGDNSQPWRFRIDGDSILLLNVPNADSTLYNFRQRGSYFAHGTIIENLSILAREKGYRLDAALFPDIPDVTAILTFSRSAEAPGSLSSAIEKRCTNRKPYKRVPLDRTHRGALLASVENTDRAELRFVEGDDQVAALAKTVSVNERLLMENRTLHDFLFGMIRWSREDERRAPGLYLKTMELPPPVQIMFRLVLKHWAFVRFFNVFGLSRFIPVQSRAGYRASSAFGAIVISGTANEDFVEAGRAMQRVWLTATSLGLNVQPVTAIPYLAQRVEEGAASAFVPHHQQMIADANKAISSAFRLTGDERIAMLFRIGYGEPPTATSSKVPPVFQEK